MSEQIVSFEAKQLQKEKKRRLEEIQRIGIVSAIGIAAVYGLINSGYVDNPFNVRPDTSVLIEDTLVRTDNNK